MAMNINPALTDFYNQFGTDKGQDWAAEAAARIQKHADVKAVGDAAMRARQDFVTNLDVTKTNLMDLARTDPTSHDLALDLADITMRGLTGVMGHAPEHHDAILGHMQSEIAHSAVQGLAEKDATAARAALTSGRLAGLIPDDQKEALHSYINAQEDQRNVDAEARQTEVVRQHVLGSGKAANEWLSGLADPATGQIWYPDNWGQRMLKDDRLSPWDKAGLQGAYRNLLANGNPTESDPHLVHDLLQRAALPHTDPDNPTVSEIFSYVGAKKPDVTSTDTYRYQAMRGAASGDPVIDENGNPAFATRAMDDRMHRPGDIPYSDVPGDPVINPRERVNPRTPTIEDYRGPEFGVGGLTLADAKFLASRSGPQTPDVDASTSRIAEVMTQAKNSINNDGAFGRFVNWLLPTMQSGMASLDPNAKEYALTPERMATFTPTGDELIARLVPSADMVKRPLGEIMSEHFDTDAPRGFAMRRSNADYRHGDENAQPMTLRRGLETTWHDITTGIPDAVARGADRGWNGEKDTKEAGTAAYANPNLFEETKGTPYNIPQRETMVNMVPPSNDAKLPEDEQ